MGGKGSGQGKTNIYAPKKLKKNLKVAGITHKNLAIEFGVAEATISRYLGKKRKCPPELLEKMQDLVKYPRGKHDR